MRLRHIGALCVEKRLTDRVVCGIHCVQLSTNNFNWSETLGTKFDTIAAAFANLFGFDCNFWGFMIEYILLKYKHFCRFILWQKEFPACQTSSL